MGTVKKQDIYFAFGATIFFAPFVVSTAVYNLYAEINEHHGMIMSFLKFAILATLGEVIGLRIRTGQYSTKGFGILPRAVVWGFLGLTIKLAMIIFSTGTPIFVQYLGLRNAVASMNAPLSPAKALTAFSISVAMNCCFAPVMMTLHKITDTHIHNNGGTLRGLFRPIQTAKILSELNWKIQCNFVFKKTIPLFWIPAHTVTFLLPENMQVLFAAMLGVALGVILAVASQMGNRVGVPGNAKIGVTHHNTPK